ncbi:unnamed protein product, partial [Ectocarpus fasciculatus]
MTRRAALQPSRHLRFEWWGFFFFVRRVETGCAFSLRLFSSMPGFERGPRWTLIKWHLSSAPLATRRGIVWVLPLHLHRSTPGV